MPVAPFVTTAERVARAASRDDTRPVLTGVLVRIGPDGITMVATDSYRLAVMQTPLEICWRKPVRRSSRRERCRRWVDLRPPMKVESFDLILSESQAVFRIGGARLTSRLIDGQFPDYRQLIPDHFEHEVVFERAELGAVLSRIGVLAQRSAPIRLAFEPGQVTVSAVSEQLGEGHESLPVTFSGEPLEIGFNAEFLRDGVENISGDEVKLGLISPLRPGLQSGGDDGYRYLLMPIRLNV